MRVGDKATYEGEPAIELEAAAWRALDNEIAHFPDDNAGYFASGPSWPDGPYVLDQKALFEALLGGIEAGAPAYRLALERMGIAQSMSRKGNCLDNAKAENFFSMVKTELYYDWEGDDPDIFERDLEKYIDWYNNVRIKRRLDGSSPVEYRLSRAA